MPRRSDLTNNGEIKRSRPLDKWFLAGLSSSRWVVCVAVAANQSLNNSSVGDRSPVAASLGSSLGPRLYPQTSSVAVSCLSSGSVGSATYLPTSLDPMTRSRVRTPRAPSERPLRPRGRHSWTAAPARPPSACDATALHLMSRISRECETLLISGGSQREEEEEEEEQREEDEEEEEEDLSWCRIFLHVSPYSVRQVLPLPSARLLFLISPFVFLLSCTL